MNWQSKEEEIKHILNTQDFEYNEHDWSAMEKMLRLKKLKKRAARFSLLMLLVLGTSVTAWWLHSSGSTSGTKNSLAANTQQTEKLGEQHPNSAGGKPLSGIDVDNAQIESAEPEQAPAALAGTATHHSISGAENLATQGDYEHQLQALLNNNTANNSETDATSGNKTNAITETNETPGTELNTETNTSGKGQQSPGNENSGNGEENATPGNNPAAQAAVPGAGKDIPSPDSAQKAPRVVKPEVDKPTVHQGLFVVLGANYSRLLQGTERNYLSSPYFGLQYAYGVGKHWQLATGLAYSVLNGDGLSKQFTATQHTFGENHTSLTISTSRLQYIEMPIFARYRLNKWNLAGGLNVAYLLSTKNKVDETIANVATGGTTVNNSSGSRYMHGLNTWDLQLQLGLERSLGKYLHAGLLANGGLLDVGRNSYYAGRFERNVRLQFYLRYEFFRF